MTLVREESDGAFEGLPIAPAFSFASSFAQQSIQCAAKEEKNPKQDNDDNEESFITNKMIQNVVNRSRRRGSKTTDDIKEVITKGLVQIKGAEDDEDDCKSGAGSRRGSGHHVPALTRSRSVKIQRVKFGLLQDAQEGTIRIKLIRLCTYGTYARRKC